MMLPKGRYPKTRGLVLTALFASLLSVFSVLSIPLPFSPVPVTLQVLIVFLIVALLGSYYGALACLVYILFGAIGLPVFAGGSAGLAALLGPLGGYLFSFPIATIAGRAICSKVSNKRRIDAVKISLAFLTLLAIIYTIGVIWLAESLNVALSQAFLLGALPFIPVDTAKAIIAVPIALYLRSSQLSLPVMRSDKLEIKPKLEAP